MVKKIIIGDQTLRYTQHSFCVIPVQLPHTPVSLIEFGIKTVKRRTSWE